MSLTQTINYDNASNFTFDSTLVEFVGSEAKLKLLALLTNEKFMAKFSTNFNGNRASGTAASTGQSGVSIAGGKLNAKGGTASFVKFNIDNFTSFAAANEGCIRFKYTPNYNGSAPTIYPLFDIHNSSNNNNRIWFAHNSADLTLRVHDGAGSPTIIFNAAWSTAVLGQEYEIEVGWKSGGTTYIALDGTILATNSSALTNGFGVLNEIILFNFQGGTYLSNGEMRDFQMFDKVQHTANFTGEVPRLVNLYSIASPRVLVNASFSSDELLTFLETVTKPAGTEVKYTIRVSGQPKYHNGSSWVNSNATYAQANTAAEVAANLSSLDLSDGEDIRVAAYLNTTLAEDGPKITTLTIGYDFYLGPTLPRVCAVYGWVFDNCGDPVVGAKVCVDSKDYFHNGRLIAGKCCTLTNSEGSFDIDVVETFTTNTTVDFVISYTDIDGNEVENKYKGLVIPDADSVGFSTLL